MNGKDIRRKKAAKKNIKRMTSTAQKMKFSIMDFFSKCDQIRSFLEQNIWSKVRESLKFNRTKNLGSISAYFLTPIDINFG